MLRKLIKQIKRRGNMLEWATVLQCAQGQSNRVSVAGIMAYRRQGMKSGMYGEGELKEQ